VVAEVCLEKAVNAQADSALMFMNQVVGVLVRTDNIEPDSVVLGDRADGVYHVHVADRLKRNRDFPCCSAKELMES